MMKQRILCILITALAFQFSYSQDAIARLKYDEAEEAFSKSDYSLTITRLDEVEKILGSTNPRILYLRIQADNKMVEADPYRSFARLEGLRKNCNFYLDKYEKNEGIEEKFREVYKINEKLKAYPASAAAFDAAVKTENARITAERNAADKKQASITYFRNFREKYKFKPGLTLDEFTSYNKDAAVLARRKRTWYKDGSGASSFSNGRGSGNPYPEGAFGMFMGDKKNSEIVTMYDYIPKSGKNEQEVLDAFNALKAELFNAIDEQFINMQPDGFGGTIINVTVPGEGYLMVSYSNYDKKWYRLILTFT